MYFINSNISIYFRVNVKMKKPTLCFCFTGIVFNELNLTVSFLLIRKTWDANLLVRCGDGGILRNKEGMVLE